MKHTSVRFWTLLVVLLVSAGCSSGTKAKTEAIPGKIQRDVLPFIGQVEVQRHQLPNGLRVLIVEDHTSPTFAYQTCYHVGSINEVPKYTGLAHLFEHMMFKRTKTFPEGEYDRRVDSAGSENMNAFTTRDSTCYLLELPKDKLELIMMLESDRMVNLVVDEEAFRTERDVVHNERRFRFENNPDGLIYEEIFDIAFTTHPYHWPTIGYPEDLDRMKAMDAEAFYKKHYRPDNATLVIVGDVRPGEVMELVNKYYAGLGTVNPTPIKQNIQQEAAQTTARHKTLHLNMKTEKIMMSYHVPPAFDADAPVFEVIQGILSQSRSSRLNRALVDTGIAASISTGVFAYQDPTIFSFVATMQPGKKASLTEEIILRELAKLKAKPIGDDEIERARNVMSFGFYEEIGTNMGKAGFLAQNECIGGDFRAGLRIREGISKVTATDIQRVAKKYFAETNRSVVLGVPK